ncbi:hypothetical protein FNJ88_05885 [Chryseobacterium sp. SNU WT5]|uniref:hypothetical protein n=1 Tax=Chryseobacterium sp. SNU WT5 TaxID=2594269 RepID=UPI0011809C93|nr:hypothetical protein [Chryseobacterium sp. SNU WT5]QDP85113.1 hypothetical protein FNJ88_05885 [Chryseobacterium sp. SNU WT5]
MKKLVIFTFALFLATGCAKEQTASSMETAVSEKDPNEVSLEQTPIKLQSEDGKTVSVTYFAKGEDVAVKIVKDNEPEEILIAKKVSSKGDPVFTNEKLMWEGSIGTGGKLTDVAGNVTEYREKEVTK